MMRIGIAGLLLTAAGLVSAAGGGEQLEHAGANVHDLASVQRGAALFVNYCHGCHSAQYMRYQRLAQDLGLSEDQVGKFLVFGDRKVTDYMTAVMPAESENWFGTKPPDLTLAARSRGEDWIYSFLQGFYRTEEGWNNTVLPNASMPHVLWRLQGIQRPVLETWTDESGEEHTRIASLALHEPGSMSPEEFDAAMRDLVAFMIYLGEPAILQRESIGIWVVLFLVVFTFISWLLYKEYWRDVKK
ncbi:MAG: cytochrome c1 [Wenzhouxiangellaceae bacterium]|nr:cytochrome c1 [Wenzhouxiangellaceae bacterium]